MSEKLSRVEEQLDDALNDIPYKKPPQSRVEHQINELIAKVNSMSGASRSEMPVITESQYSVIEFNPPSSNDKSVIRSGLPFLLHSYHDHDFISVSAIGESDDYGLLVIFNPSTGVIQTGMIHLTNTYNDIPIVGPGEGYISTNENLGQQVSPDDLPTIGSSGGITYISVSDSLAQMLSDCFWSPTETSGLYISVTNEMSPEVSALLESIRSANTNNNLVALRNGNNFADPLLQIAIGDASFSAFYIEEVGVNAYSFRRITLNFSSLDPIIGIYVEIIAATEYNPSA